MDLTHYISHPEDLDHETFYSLRSLLALYPYYQTARILFLQNLFLLHDPTFSEELKRAAIYITDRKVLFNLVEASHYRLQPEKHERHDKQKDAGPEDRTTELIDSFLDSIPDDEKEQEKDHKKSKRKPTPADATVDYVAYLLETEDEEPEDERKPAPEMKGQELIDNFINEEGGKIKLNLQPDDPQQPGAQETDEQPIGTEYYTETLAKIYIKQGRYSKALDIIQQINLNNPKKSSYFADQIRFLQKLILNNNYKK